ncbi:MFS transporter [Alkalicoccus urumqiensis]|nr:MFS transporter [Alkalicoccus urumqiensis]
MWQIAFFALNNTATNIYLFAMGFVTYYATGIAGLSVLIVSTVLTAMRAFDAVTDPIIGFIVDRTETRFGKFRPIMVLGNIVLAVSFLLMFTLTHELPLAAQLPFFVLIHAIYILGYTMQTTMTRAAQTVLTNNPKQRPLFTIFDSVYNILLFTGGQLFVAAYLVEKYGDFTLGFFAELNTIVVTASAIFTVLAVIAIRSKDQKEFFGLSDFAPKVRFRDYWPILKNNRPIRMLVLAASTDKLAGQVMQQQVAQVMFFGIILGNFALSGTVSMIAIAPSLLITYLGVMYARKRGLKRTLVAASWAGVIAFTTLFVLFYLFDPQEFTLAEFGVLTVVFLALYSVGRGVSTLGPSIVIPMIADVADYETYRTGRYVPGMLGALFSLVDKAVSSLAPAIVGGLVAVIGFRDEFPTVDDTLTDGLLFVGLLAILGIPVLMWLVSIIAMKFYELDSERMEEIQAEIAKTKEEILEGKERREKYGTSVKGEDPEKKE